MNTHYPGKWLVSASVRTEERVQLLLHLSISKSCQLSSTDSPLSTVGWKHDGLIKSWLIRILTNQQVITDNELIVDRSSLSTRTPILANSCKKEERKLGGGGVGNTSSSTQTPFDIFPLALVLSTMIKQQSTHKNVCLLPLEKSLSRRSVPRRILF